MRHWQKIVSLFFVSLALCLAFAKPAGAQPFGSSIQTLIDAINGVPAARLQVSNDTRLLCGRRRDIPCPDTLLNDIVGTLGGRPLTAASFTTALAVLNQAAAGDVNALNTLQGAFKGLHFTFVFRTPRNPGPNIYDDFMNTVIAGTGNVGLLTLRQAYAGNANSLAVLNYLFDGKVLGPIRAPSPTTILDLFRAGIPTGSAAETVAVLNDAISGDAIAINRIRISINNILTFSSFALDATSAAFLQGILNSFGGVPPLSDIDGDGIADVNDPDIDGDGEPNVTDTDDDGDGIPDSQENDTDGDGIPDGTDNDDDGDGIPDGTDDDDDDDGIPDFQDADIDNDGDGIPDIIDTDDDGDGILDVVDSDDDGDGIEDLVDIDSAVGNTGNPTTSCGDETAPLTGSFDVDPCEPTRDSRSSEVRGTCYDGMDGSCQIRWKSDCAYAEDFQGGEQFSRYLRDWWSCQQSPAMKTMMTQIHAGVIDQSRQLGQGLGANTLGNNARAQQVKELEAKKRLLPNEQTCVAASHTPAIAQTQSFSRKLTQGLKNESRTRSGGAPGTPASVSPVTDMVERMKKYCQYFLNPDANNGVNSCPAPTTPGPCVDCDIGIEDFLFRKTIDFSKPENREAATALIANLVNPTVFQKMPAHVVNTALGHNVQLKREYVESIQAIALYPITKALAERAAVPLSPDVMATLGDLRVRAGGEPASKNDPISYSEITDLMTQGMFFDPMYFVNINNDMGAVMQEQAAVNARIAVMTQDIEDMQESITLLLAARASMQYNKETAPNKQNYTPVRP